MGACEMLIEKPIMHMRRPAKMKGDRSLSASEAAANAMSVTTELQTLHQLALKRRSIPGDTHLHRCTAGLRAAG